MKFIIMGCGRLGSQLAYILNKEGQDVTILDIDERSFQRLPRDFSGTAILGSGLSERMLEQAGIKEADAFIAVTQGDNRNIMAAEIAKFTYSVPKVACRVYDPRRAEIFNQLGIKTLSPTSIFAEMLRARLEA